MRKILFGKTQNSLFQFIRYLFVGGFAAIIDTACLYLLHTYLNMNHFAAAAVGFSAGLVANYVISIAWVFDSSGKMKEEFALFAMIGITGLAWTELILWLTINQIGLHILAGKAIALGLVLIWNFGMRKKFVFAMNSTNSTKESTFEAA